MCQLCTIWWIVLFFHKKDRGEVFSYYFCWCYVLIFRINILFGMLHLKNYLRISSTIQRCLSGFYIIFALSIFHFRPHPNECSGSDLDGDIYFVCWDDELIPHKQFEPMDYSPAPTTRLDHDVRIEVLISCKIMHVALLLFFYFSLPFLFCRLCRLATSVKISSC